MFACYVYVGAECMVCCVWDGVCEAEGAGCAVPGLWYLVYGVWRRVWCGVGAAEGVHFLLSGMWYVVCLMKRTQNCTRCSSPI